MREITIQLRAMQLFAHSAHNLCARMVFHSDHEFFGDAYSAYEGEYDGVIERIIGTKDESLVKLQDILQAVVMKLQSAPSIGVKENSIFYQYLLSMENELYMLIEKEIKSVGVSCGTEQMLGNIADASEIRKYKIKQRLKK